MFIENTSISNEYVVATSLPASVPGGSPVSVTVIVIVVCPAIFVAGLICNVLSESLSPLGAVTIIFSADSGTKLVLEDATCNVKAAVPVSKSDILNTNSSVSVFSSISIVVPASGNVP